MGPLYVNADWSALVPAGSPEAAFGITPKDAMRRGLLETDEVIEQAPTMVSANLVAEPADEVKEAPKPADKARRKPATK